MDHFRRLLIVFLCLAVALAGRGPVTELGAFGNGHGDRVAAVARAAHAPLAPAGHVHGHETGSSRALLASGHAHGGDGASRPGADTCACGCDTGNCAAMPANFSLQHPDLARIDPRIELPDLRATLHSPSPTATLLRPPIG